MGVVVEEGGERRDGVLECIARALCVSKYSASGGGCSSDAAGQGPQRRVKGINEEPLLGRARVVYWLASHTYELTAFPAMCDLDHIPGTFRCGRHCLSSSN